MIVPGRMVSVHENLAQAGAILRAARDRRRLRVEKLRATFGTDWKYSGGWRELGLMMWDQQLPDGWAIERPWDGKNWEYPLWEEPPPQGNWMPRPVNKSHHWGQLFQLLGDPEGPIVKELPGGALLVRGMQKEHAGSVTINPDADSPGGWWCDKDGCRRNQRKRIERKDQHPWCLHVDVGRIASGLSWLADPRKTKIREEETPPSRPQSQAEKQAVEVEANAPRRAPAKGKRQTRFIQRPIQRRPMPTSRVVRNLRIFDGDALVHIGECSEAYASIVVQSLTPRSKEKAPEPVSEPQKLGSLDYAGLARVLVSTTAQGPQELETILDAWMPGWHDWPARDQEHLRRRFSHAIESKRKLPRALKAYGYQRVAISKHPGDGRRSIYGVA